MVTQSVARRQPLLSAAQLCHMAANRTSVNTLGMDWLHPTAADRASVRAQAEGVKAYHVANNEWVVPSASQPGTAHKVMVWGTRVACSCECGRSGGSCKHAAAVRIELAKSAPVAEVKVPAPKPANKLIIAPAVIANRAQAERYIEAKIRSIAQLYGDD